MKKQLLFLYCVFSLFTACTPAENRQPEPAAPVFDEEKEKAAIMATIERETECFFKSDYECWKTTYAQTDYAFQAWSNADGTFDAKTGWQEVDEKIGKYIRENPVPGVGSIHPKVERRNMIVKFYGDQVAYMIWDQYNIRQDLKNYAHSKEIRIMEKIDGQWKIVNVSAFWDYVNLVAVDSLR